MADFRDHSGLVRRIIEANSQQAVQAAADRWAEAVREKILHGYPEGDSAGIVDTGRLLESIGVCVTRESPSVVTAEVGSDAPYAVYVHEGTSRIGGRPFLADAASESWEKIRERLADGLKEGL